MKTIYFASLIVVLLSASSFFQPARKKVIFFGDSITEAAVKPGGYIRLMDSLIAAAQKSSQYELVGAGISGNKIYDLYKNKSKSLSNYIFGGRLAEYKYYDMHQVIASALSKTKKIILKNE